MKNFIELIMDSNFLEISLYSVFAVGFLFLISYLYIVWEQRSYEKSIMGKALPSNRVLKKITKDIEHGQAFTVEKVNGKWTATVRNK